MIVEMSAAVNRPAGTCNNEYVYNKMQYLPVLMQLLQNGILSE